METVTATITDIKDTATVKVAGNKFEKGLYYLMFVAVVVLFVLECVTIGLAAGSPITEVTLSQETSINFPAIIWCYDSGHDWDKVRWEDEEEKYTGEAPHMFKYSASGSKQLVLEDEGASTEYMNLAHVWKNYTQCIVFNGSTDGSVLSSEGLDSLELRAYISDEPVAEGMRKWGDSSLSEVIVADPVVPLEDQMGALFPYPVSFVNMQVHMFFTVDKYVSKVGNGLLGSMMMQSEGDEVVYKYNTQVQTVPFKPWIGVADENTNGHNQFELQVRAAGYTVRTVTTRHKSFTEIWTEVGGAWASCLLVMVIFFKKQEVQGKEKTDRMEEVQVLRLRGKKTRTELLKEIATMLHESKDVAGDRADKAEVEIGNL